MNEIEFTEMVKSIREAELAIGKVEYELTPKQLKGKDFSRSLYVVKDIEEGEELTTENIRSIRPGFGAHPKFLPEVIGKRAKIKMKTGDRFDINSVY
jgi:pseudaminic acid synthase